jgi:GGDEF domain-containing protein
MSEAEAKQALKTDEMSGLGSKRAWDETDKKAHIAAIDADGLGAINKHYGEPAGDALIQAVGDALREAGLGKDAFRRGGDEIRAHGDDRAALQAAIEKARTILENKVVSFTDEHGNEHHLTGASLSHGIEGNEKAADTALRANKEERRKAGLRAGNKEELPPTLKEVDKNGNPTEAKPTEAKPTKAKPTKAKPTETKPATLPKNLKKPVKVYVEGKARTVRFVSDVDHALFVVGGGKSANDSDLMTFLRGQFPKATDAQIRAIGEKVRASVRQAAKGGEGSLAMPALYRQSDPLVGKKGGGVEAGHNWQDDQNPKIAPVGTPGGDMSDFQNFGTNFPVSDAEGRPVPFSMGGSGEDSVNLGGGAVTDPHLTGTQAPEKPPGTPQEEAPDFAHKLAAHPFNVEQFVNARGDESQVADTLKTVLGRQFTMPLKERYQAIRNSIKGLTDGFTQTFAGLDKTLENAEFEKGLLRRMDGDTIAGAYTHRSIKEALRGLSKEEQYTLNWQRYVNDMVAAIDKQRKEWTGKASDFKPLLPTGFTEETARESKRKTEAYLTSAEAKKDGVDAKKIADAHDKIVAYRKQVVDRYVELYHQVNGVKLDLDPDTYFRHNILYLEAAEHAMKGSGSPNRVQTNPGRSFLKKRLGSEMAYNTNFVEAELTWLPEMIKDTLDLEILHHVQEHYDLSRQVKLAQAELGDKGMVGYLTEHRDGKPVSVDKLETLAKLAAEGRLPDKLNGEFKVLRDALVGIYEKNLQAKVNGHAPTPLSPEMRAHLKEYAKWVLEPDEKGGVKVRALLDDPRWLERNGYKAFQAQEGRHFFRAMTVPERLLKDANGASLAHVLIDKADLKTILAQGAKRKTMYLPAHIADLLENYTGSRGDTYQNRLQRAAGWLQAAWKWDKLYNPVHSPVYWLGNARSDAEAMWRGNPKALRYIPHAVKEVGKALLTGKVSPELAHWIDRGGLGSTFVAREGLGRGAGIDVLRQYYTHQPPTWQKTKQGFYNMMELPHEWREAAGRYASYLAFLDDIKNNGGMPKRYGASPHEMVDGLTDYRDKAYKLANDLIGAYNEVSPYGQTLRKRLPVLVLAGGELQARASVRPQCDQLPRPRPRLGLAPERRAGVHDGDAPVGLGRRLGRPDGRGVEPDVFRERLPQAPPRSDAKVVRARVGDEAGPEDRRTGLRGPPRQLRRLDRLAQPE